VGQITAQDFSNKGKDFWFGYGYHSNMLNSNGTPVSSGGTQDMILYFTSDKNATVTVEVPGIGYSKTYTLTANLAIFSDPIPKSGTQDARIYDTGYFNKGIHVTSDVPIVAYAHIYNSSISGASLLFPTNTLGKEYYSINFTQSTNVVYGYSNFFVVGTEDNTTVEITPSAINKNNRTPGIPFYVTLNKGQIYSVFGSNTNIGTAQSTGSDLTGSRIRSISSGNEPCKKIAVFSGSGKMSIGGNNFGSADNLFAQAFPANAWGTKYLTVPTGSQPNNYFRICVRDPTTVVKLNGVVLPVSSLINSFYYQFKNSGGTTSPAPNIIESDKPILVAQYCTTQGQDGNPSTTPGGDPEMIYLSPTQQTINNITLYSASKNAILQSYINIVIRKEGVSSFKLDGQVPLSSSFYSSGFQTHPGDANYSYATLKVSSGSHSLYSDSGFNAIAYGFGSAESYGYNAGTNVIDLNPPVSVQNDYSATNVSYSATCTNSPFKLTLSLTYQPEKFVVDFNGVAGINDPQPFTYTPIVSAATPNKYDSTYISNGKTYYLYRIPKSYSFTAGGSYPVKITTTTTSPQFDGCSSTNEQEITDDIIVNAPPTADFAISSNGCVNNAIALTDLSDGVGRPLVRWIWEFSDGTTASTQNPSKTFTTANNYSVKLTSVTDFGCIAQISKSINVSAKPIAGFTVPATRCLNSNIVFTDASSIVAGSAANSIAQWNWNLDNGAGIINATSNAAQNVTYSSWGNKNVSLITVSNTGCTSDPFTIQGFKINPLPEVNFVVPEICLADANAPFLGTSKIADGTEAQFVYAWKFNDGSPAINPGPTFTPAMVNQKDPLPKYNAVGVYTVSLTVTSNNNCVASKSSPFTVNGSVPNASFTVQSNLLCSNDSIKILNTSSVDFGSLTRMDIIWDINGPPSDLKRDENPTPNNTYANLYPAFLTPRSKDVEIKIIAYSGNSAVCQRTVSQKIKLLNAPKATFTDIRDICYDAAPRQLNQGSFVPLSDVVGIYSGKGISAAGLLDPVKTGVGNDQIKYLATTTAGCKDSAFQPLTVWPSPEAKWSVQSVLCEKNDLAFTDNSVANFSNIITRKWIFGDGSSLPNTTAVSFNKKYINAQNYSVSLQVVTDSGCVSKVNQQDIKVNPLPIPAFTLPRICLPDGRGTFTNQSSISDNSEALFSYSWNFGNPNDPSSSTLREPTHKYTAVGPVNVQLKITTKDACVDSLTKTMNTIYPWPKASFSATPMEVCVGDTIQFKDLGDLINSGNTAIWNWDLSGGTSSTVQNPLKRFADSGTFTIKYFFYNVNGCVSDTVSKNVTVHPYPKLTLISKVNVLEGNSYKIVPKYKYGTNLTYQWTPPTYLNNDVDSTPVTTPLADIRYRLFLTGIGGCTVSDTIFIKVLFAPIAPNAFSPNGDGINDRWRIKYLESYPGATVEVFNRYGQSVFSSEGYDVDWDGTVNGKALPIGTYYYVINPKNGRKIVTGSVTIIR
jgi:gliding motility-associated-like protein